MHPDVGSDLACLGQLDLVHGRRVSRRSAGSSFQRRLKFPDRRVARGFARTILTSLFTTLPPATFATLRQFALVPPRADGAMVSGISLNPRLYCGVALCPGTVRSIKATFSRSPCSAGLAYSSPCRSCFSTSPGDWF